MTNARRAALVMVLIAGVEAWPLTMIGLSTDGPAKLGRMLGVGAAPIPPLAWALAAAVALAYSGASMVGLPYIRRRLFDLSGLKLLAVPFALITGTFEELFFRRWLMDLVRDRGGEILIQVAAAALVFGLAHGVWGLFGRSLRAAANATIATAVLGAALAGVYLLAGRQMAPCAWSHIAVNLMIEPWLLLAFMERSRPSEPALAV